VRSATRPENFLSDSDNISKLVFGVYTINGDIPLGLMISYKVTMNFNVLYY
jgi:hypothetical protein